MRNRLIKIAIAGSTAGVLCLGLGSANIAAHACPTSHAPSANNTDDPSEEMVPGVPVYNSPGGDPATGAGYVGVDFGNNVDPTGNGSVSGSAEANSGTSGSVNDPTGPTRPPISDHQGYVVAQGTSPEGDGGIIVYDPSGPNATSTGTC